MGCGPPVRAVARAEAPGTPARAGSTQPRTWAMVHRDAPASEVLVATFGDHRGAEDGWGAVRDVGRSTLGEGGTAQSTDGCDQVRRRGPARTSTSRERHRSGTPEDAAPCRAEADADSTAASLDPARWQRRCGLDASRAPMRGPVRSTCTATSTSARCSPPGGHEMSRDRLRRQPHPCRRARGAPPPAARDVAGLLLSWITWARGAPPRHRGARRRRRDRVGPDRARPGDRSSRPIVTSSVRVMLRS